MTPEEELQGMLNSNKTPANGNDTTGAGTGTTTPEPTQQPMQADGFWETGEVQTPPIIQKEQPPVSDTGTAAAQPAGQQAATVPQNNATGITPQGQRITRETLNTSARTCVAAIGFAQTTILRPLMNWRFTKEAEKRFGENLPRAMEMAMEDITPTEPKEKAIKTRFTKFLKQRDKKIEGIPFTDDEEQDMERAFKAYFEMKQVSMSPDVLLWCTIITTVGKRGVDVMMWD